MLSYITVGANDVAISGRFYAAILTPLGYEKKEVADAVEFTSQDVPDGGYGPISVYVKKPYDGNKATAGNGSMTAFRAETHEMVRSLHSAGLAAGRSDEGGPRFRDEYADRFYVGYVRGPLGNKVAIFSVNPAERTRGH